MAHNSSRRCQSWFERARREASREKIAPTWPMATSLTEVAIEDSDLLRAPAESLRLAHQIVLALGALLVEADLAHRRLTNVDASLSRQMSIGNLGDHHDRLPLGWTAGRPQQGKIRSCRR